MSERTHVGVLGGGQLGRMLGLAGHRLGIACRFYDPAPNACAGDVGEHMVAEWDDAEALTEFVRGVDGAAPLDALTFEFENVPVRTLARAEGLCPVHPTGSSLRVACDRLLEKEHFEAAGLGVQAFAPVDSIERLREAVEGIGFPCVLKRRSGGYDGKGQAVIRDAAGLEAAWAQVAPDEAPCLLEAFVEFSREVSLVGVRSADGHVRFYPACENVHEDGILRTTIAPAPNVNRAALTSAQDAIKRLLERSSHVGAFSVELFDTGDALIGNEMAPRVHNTGHWTIEGAHTSQFENHLRGVLGWELGSTDVVAPGAVCAMVNIIGDHPPASELGAIEGAHVHLYAKDPRPGRKVGHITLIDNDGPSLAERVARARAIVG